MCVSLVAKFIFKFFINELLLLLHLMYSIYSTDCKDVSLTSEDNDKITIMTGIIMTVERTEHNQN